MEYFEAVNYLTDLQQTRPKLGTETTAEMLEFLDDPHEGVDYVQVAGSNGKGSTASMTAHALRSAGLNVGLYTSPDLNDIRERISVNGRAIAKADLASLVEQIRPHVAERAADGDAPTKFEVLTVLAFAYFGEQDVDVAVLEVGIGGRHDATSVIDPVASAVTSVSLEHTGILGDTVEEIALDKAHVAPADRPLVTGATGRALSAIREQTDVVTVGERDADVRVRTAGLASRTEQAVTVDGPDWRIDTRISLLGRYQAINAGIAATLARQVAGVDEERLEQGLRRVNWPGRFEIVGSDPHVVLDGAHNPDACAKLASLVEQYDYDELHLVFGALREKDHAGMIANLPAADTVTLCRPAVDRAESPDTLERVVCRRTDAPVEITPAVLDAVERRLHSAGADDLVLVTGSLYTVSEARDRWTRAVIPKRTDDRESARTVLANSQVPPERTAEVIDDVSNRTIKTYCRRERARQLERLMLSLGGTAAVSGVRGVHQHVDVVLSGSDAQFRRLIESVEGDAGELAHVGSQLRSALELGDDHNPPRELVWDGDPAIMGALNVATDSFHDGGESQGLDAAVSRADALIAGGADIVDVGGESTRPGATPVSAAEEIDRVVPVVEALADAIVPVSVDTRKAAVAEAAVEAGADVVNDLTGLADPEMRRVVAEHDVPVVVTHSRGAPANPERTVMYDDVVEDVVGDLTERLLLAERAGIGRERIVVDPGIGFGKSATESFELIDRLGEFRALGCPVLVGHSRKSLFDHDGCGADDPLAQTVATTALAVERGANVVRVHDVAENAAAVRAARAVSGRE